MTNTWLKLAAQGQLYGQNNKPRSKKSTKKQRKLAKKRQVITFAKENRHDPTPAEQCFSKILKQLKIPFESQRVIAIENHLFIVDFYLSDYFTAIEIDGNYHNDPKQCIKDRKRQHLILKNNTVNKVLRFTNDEVLSGTITDITWQLLVGLMPQIAMLFDKHTMQISAVWKQPVRMPEFTTRTSPALCGK